MIREKIIKLIWVLGAMLVLLLVAAFLLPQKTPEISNQQPQQTQQGTQDTGTENQEGDTAGQETPAPDPEQAETEELLPEINPSVIGLYIPADDGTKDRKLVTEFKAKRTAKKDIDCFEAIASSEERLKGKSFSGIWNDAWNAYSNTAGSKIGYYISFTLKDGTAIEKLLLKPGDGKDFYSYVEIYMYDDIHQTPGVRYSHLEDEDMKQDTIISSIKLTSGSKISQVEDIQLTVFVYSDERHIRDGVYRGDVSSTILITK